MDDRLKDRLAFLGSLASGLAHEIKNPLSTMTITLGLLHEDFEEPASPRERRTLRKVQLLESEVARLEHIVQDFLQFAGGHTVRPELVALNAWIEELLEFFEPSCADGGVELRSQLAPDLPQVLIDRELMKQAVLNLLTNARQAMPDGGELMVRTWSHGDRVRIDVIDTGVGIERGVLPRVWQVYFSTKGQGTGLGLPTVRRIVAEHGGEVQLTSESGKGTCVSILLPVPPAITGTEHLRLPGTQEIEDDLTAMLAPPDDGDAAGTDDPEEPDA